MLDETLRTLVDPAWTGPTEPVEYRMYDLEHPHCEDARSYRDIYGRPRWRCTHSARAQETPPQRAGAAGGDDGAALTPRTVAKLRGLSLPAMPGGAP